jgi:hypothetical protein
MKVYCAHNQRSFSRSSNYYKCGVCSAGWYSNEPIPLVLLGQTDPVDVNPKYMDEFEAKDLSKKIFTRCEICKDLLEKRKHRLCSVKSYVNRLKLRHAELAARLKKVVAGFGAD